MKKRILSMIMATVIFITMMPQFVLAQNDKTPKGIPFTAKIGEQELTVTAGKDNCVNNGEVDTYTIMLPENNTETTVSITGLNDYMFKAGSCSSDNLDFIGELWEASILTDNEYYCIEGNLFFHIYFKTSGGGDSGSGDGGGDSGAVVPFTAKIDGKELTVTAGTEKCDWVPDVNVSSYTITVPKAQDKVSITGLETAFVSNGSCQGAEVTNRDEPWQAKVLPEGEYYCVEADSKFHIKFKINNISEPPKDDNTLNENDSKAPNFSLENTIGIPDDFENDLWTQYDFKELKIGEKAEIYPRRVPQIIDDPIINNVVRPNFNYTILAGDSIELCEENSDKSIGIKAVKNGISIVKITYDSAKCNEKNYGASSQVNTAYVVLDVNENPANLTINSSVTDITSYDTIYFNKGDTVPYSFTVDVPDAKKVEVTVNGNTVSSQGKEYTANLLNGANIIGINATAENGKRKSYYQVIDARKMEIIIANKTNPEKPLKINDKANISFKGITPPIYKLATIYNPTWRSVDGMWEKTYGNYVEYTNEHFGEVIGVAGQWDLATNNDFDITIDKEGTFTFSGGKINGEWWGEQLGTDKKVKMLSQNTDANINSKKFCVLPDFSITIGNEVSTNVPVKGITLNKTEIELKQGETFQLQAMVTPQNATNKTVSWSTSGKYFVTVDTQGKITAVNASTDKVPEVVITAKTNDGEFIATCKVVVTSKSNQSDKIVAERVMQQISALFPVTLKSEYAINYVKAEYNKLTAEQKKLVTNINDLYLAENILIKLKQDEKQKVNPKDQKVAEDVIGMISALKDITMDSEGAITDAIKAYNKLTVEQKKLVTNIVELFQAENKLLRLKLEAKPNNNDKNKTDINISAPSYNHKEDNIPSNPISEEIQTIQVPESATQQTVEIAKKINDNLVLLSKDSSAISPIEQNMLIKLVQEYIALPEEQKILVPYCEKVEDFIESIKSSNQQDKKTGIKVDGADWFIGINVNSATDSPRGFKQVKKIQEQIGNNELLSVWDISLNNIIDNKEYTPNTPVKISLPINYFADDKNICVVHCKDDGTIEYIDPVITNSDISFETNEFSYYALVSYDEKNSPFDLNNALNGETTIESEVIKDKENSILPIIIIVLAVNTLITLAIVFVFYSLKSGNKKEHSIEK